jgi:hypothetical protein
MCRHLQYAARLQELDEMMKALEEQKAQMKEQIRQIEEAQT